MLPHSRSPFVHPARALSRAASPSSRRALTAVGAGVLALALTGAVAAPSGAVGADGRAGKGPASSPGSDQRGGTTGGLDGFPGDLSARLSTDKSMPQTSDGIPGLIAPQAHNARAVRTITNTVTAQWEVAPGLHFARFDRTDSLRGNVRGQVLVVDNATPGLSLDYTAPKAIAKVQTVDRLTARGNGVAGVNGDFFDIGDTGASLGIGAGRGTGLVKGPQSGWNAAFYVDSAGVSHIVPDLPVTTTIKKHKRMKVDALNPPSVPTGGIAAYDQDWGRSLRSYQVADLQKKRVRQVEIKGGRIVANRTKMVANLKLRSNVKVLIGRGKGANKLSKLKVGSRGGFRSSISGNPPVVITGNKPLLINGIRQVIDDREMHPRTAIGIDRDTNRIFIVVVDGRQDFSRGMTMVELSQLMTDLGADDALNLDGGGSSTMLAKDANGVMGVQNSPSDGFLRKVANGLVVNYVPTAPVPAPSTPTLFPPPPTPTPTPAPTPTVAPTVVPTTAPPTPIG